MTTDERKSIEQFFNKPITQIDTIDIPAYIRQREKRELQSAMKTFEIGNKIIINELKKIYEE